MTFQHMATMIFGTTFALISFQQEWCKSTVPLGCGYKLSILLTSQAVMWCEKYL
jgi:hypothetical protein